MSTTDSDPRTVFFFDIDNCLYSKNKYFETHLSLTTEEANELHLRYYRDYGLAIEGLVRHHKVDPLEYNRLVDNALPLDEVLKPDPALRTLLQDLDTSKVKPWLFTNAYVTHGQRVVKLLGVEDCFEGITYCDYGKMPFLCKPARAMYEKAEVEAGVRGEDKQSEKVFFVDDSYLNCVHASRYGWTTVHLLEPPVAGEPPAAPQYRIESLLELKRLFPDFFKSTSSSHTR